MIINNLKLSVTCVFLLTLIGCSSFNQNLIPLEEHNERIEYRDLTTTKNDSSFSNDGHSSCKNIIEPQDQKECSNNVVVEKVENREILTVNFSNESTVLTNSLNKDLIGFKKELDLNGRYIVVGHSHGKSAKGNSYLSMKRAKGVYNWLLNSGVPSDNVHLLASWSNKKKPFFPPIGVQVFKVDSDYTITLNSREGL